MENNKTQYWKGLEELHGDTAFEKQRYNEFAEKLPLGNVISEPEMGLSANRRDFLKFMGFSISAATLAACVKTPVKQVIPYVIKPIDIDPGVANYYATTCSGCAANCSLVVKTREGRPIKIEGNAESPLNRGGACSVGQATVLSLYDSGRLAHPTRNKNKIGWQDLDKEVLGKLKTIAAAGGQIRILTGTVNSPSTLNIIKEFKAKYPTAQHVSYDAVSSSALIEANRQAFGKAVIPDYKIEDAKMLVSFGADFLGTWISPVEYTKQYSAARNIDNKKSMLYHVQFESTLTLSGSNADLRAPLSPSQYGAALVRLHNLIADMAGKAKAGDSNLELAGNSIKLTATQLWANRGKSIVITDSNDIDHQLIVASINSMLGNIGTTIDLSNPSYQRTGNDKDMIQLVSDMNAGKIGAIFIWNTNPSYTYPDRKKFNDGLKNVGLTVSFGDRINETGANVQIIAPDHHFLEAWGDAMPKEGYLGLSQPTISPIFDTRQAQESLLAWMEKPMAYHDYIQAHWKENYFGKQTAHTAFEDFWQHTLEIGFMKLNANTASAESFAAGANLAAAAGRVKTTDTSSSKSPVEVILYEKVSIRDGKEANNPWLQEVPDPVTKISWDNYALVSPKWAEENSLSDEDLVEITSNGYKVSLPIVRQPGQRYNTVAIAFGYGRDVDLEYGKVINEVKGANAFPFAKIVGDSIIYNGETATISGKMGTYELAMTQTHHHMEGRDLVRETTPEKMAKNEFGAPKEEGGSKIVSLWQDYRFPGHHWGMAIDLNACTGCNACVVSCNAENNVAVVGKDEVRRRREMHWIRIDRYYSLGDTDHQKMHDGYKDIDRLDADKKLDYENVKVVFQPLTCQHCSNAPCETVCPVNAISHSSEGLNQQVYNRCVGTRYCANNCPYKVRRFNWFKYFENDRFDYTMTDPLARMVLNPDVVVRSRGVMEKCSFCVQRIQAGKLQAKTERRALKDGDVKTACQQTCPANAIVFGDINDPNSEISKLIGNKRSYGILTDLNVRPNITYMSKVRATTEQQS
jgi:MoCo/4Fe-4S cofactor protein with predicted Tat translocation signal